MMNEQLAIESQGKPMELAVTKMSSMKFEPECARAFLEHCLRLIWKRNVNEGSYLKYLIISKQFLNASQQFPIFTFMALFQFEKTCLGFFPVETLDLFFLLGYKQSHGMSIVTYRCIYKLLTLLRPNHFYIVCQNLTFSIAITKKCIKLFSLVHGKIGLTLDKDTIVDSHLILNHLTGRQIGLFSCHPNMLTNPQLTSLLILDCCRVCTYINNVQLSSILRHKIKFLSLGLDDEFIDEESMSEMSSRNSPTSNFCDSLTKLHVECDDRPDSFIKLLDFVNDRCPNLKEVILQIEWSSYKWSSGVFVMVHNMDSIVARFLEIQCKIQEIMVKCKAPISKLQIDSTASILYYGAFEEFNCDWIEDVKKLGLFKNATHKHLDAEKICKLDVKLSDGFFNLRIASEIHFGPQKSSQLSD